MTLKELKEIDPEQYDGFLEYLLAQGVPTPEADDYELVEEVDEPEVDSTGSIIEDAYNKAKNSVSDPDILKAFDLVSAEDIRDAVGNSVDNLDEDMLKDIVIELARDRYSELDDDSADIADKITDAEVERQSEDTTDEGLNSKLADVADAAADRDIERVNNIVADNVDAMVDKEIERLRGPYVPKSKEDVQKMIAANKAGYHVTSDERQKDKKKDCSDSMCSDSKHQGKLIYDKDQDSGIIGALKKASPARNQKNSTVSDERQKNILTALMDARF